MRSAYNPKDGSLKKKECFLSGIAQNKVGPLFFKHHNIDWNDSSKFKNIGIFEEKDSFFYQKKTVGEKDPRYLGNARQQTFFLFRALPCVRS